MHPRTQHRKAPSRRQIYSSLQAGTAATSRSSLRTSQATWRYRRRAAAMEHVRALESKGGGHKGPSRERTAPLQIKYPRPGSRATPRRATAKGAPAATDPPTTRQRCVIRSQKGMDARARHGNERPLWQTFVLAQARRRRDDEPGRHGRFARRCSMPALAYVS
jgi:hypothetical protein